MPRPNAFGIFACALACATTMRAATTPSATQPAATQPATLPLKEVTLYTSGVGFFVHSGTVSDDGTTTLKFKTGQINDVLKSLVVTDFGGKVGGVQYPSQDPTDKTLKDFQIDLSNNPSLGELLRQLRGATVTLTSPSYSGGGHTGVIVGLSKKAVAAPQVAVTESWYVTLLEADNKLVQLRLDEAESVTLADPTLNTELQTALTAIASGRNADRRPVTISYTGRGDHVLTLGYVVETPLWKTSYRLTLAKKQSAIQGWAIVENQTDADWNDVSLNLVSGRPISFAMDLYQPLYVQRPVVQLDLFQGLKPQMYGGGIPEPDAMPAPAPTAMASISAAAPAQRALRSRMEKAGSRPRGYDGSDSVLLPTDDLSDAVKSSALTAKLGELFEYNLKHISLPRQQSSLVPIVTGAITTEPLSVYNADVLPKNPLNGVLLTNSTGKLLPQGPITVLDHGAYAGDARIEDLPAGQKRLLTFGVDLQTLVQTKDEGTSAFTGGKISKGILTLSRRQAQTKIYTVDNKSEDDKTIVVEHPIGGGDWSLVDSPKPMETSGHLYRFKVAAPKAKQTVLKVTEQHLDSMTIAILNGDVDSLVVSARDAALPQKVRDAIGEAVKRRQALVDLQRQATEKTDALAAITAEQGRIRENMKSVDKGGPYYNRMLTKLNDQESVIEGLQKDRDDLNEKAAAAREDLEKSLDGLNVE